MNRFLIWFYENNQTTLVNGINEYAAKNNLKIISLTVTENQCGAIVLFEREKSD